MLLPAALASLWRKKNPKTPLQDKTTGMDMDTTATPAPASSNTGLQAGDRVLLLAASELGVAAEAVVKAVGKGSVLMMGMPYKVRCNGQIVRLHHLGGQQHLEQLVPGDMNYDMKSLACIAVPGCHCVCTLQGSR